VDPSVPPSLERVILKALAKKPADRYQDMGEMGAALEAVQREVTGAGGGTPQPAPATGPPAEPPPPEIEVRGPGEELRRLRVREVTRGGIFCCDPGKLPPLFSAVKLSLPAEAGRSVEVAGEVVRQVTAGDAERWKMEPGFAVQLQARTPAQQQALSALAARLAAPPKTGRRTAAIPAPAALEELERRVAAGPYLLLGARPDSGFPEIREHARALRREIDSLRARLPPGDQASRVPRLLARLEAAVGLLSQPSERLMFDARHGNFQGVAHCVTAGTPPAVLEARRRALLAEYPARAQEAQRHLARAQVAQKLGNEAAALTEYEAALTADPLDLALHERYWELKRRMGGG
jgi:serine/threonine-protein kinase